MRRVHLTRRFWGGALLSILVHVGIAAASYVAWADRSGRTVVAELDLSLAPIAYSPPNAGGGIGRAQEAWVTPKKGLAPAPKPQTPSFPIDKIQEEVKKEDAAAPCVEPCSTTGTGSGGGGTGESQGRYIPADQAAQKPRWVKNFISSSDYPLIARQSGKDGRVVLAVLIDETGRVQDARLLQGAYEALNEVALRKVREAVFTPAIDTSGRPVACQVMLPIRFELK